MRYQDQIVKLTQRALDDVLRAAAALPADRVDWSPAPTARSALSQLREIAATAAWFGPLIREGRLPDLAEHESTLDEELGLEACREAAARQMGEVCEAIEAFPDSELEREVVLPFGGGTAMSMADILYLPAWNLVYHLGQVNYIQTMLGDRKMH